MKTDREKPHDQSDVTAEGRPRWLALPDARKGQESFSFRVFREREREHDL